MPFGRDLKQGAQGETDKATLERTPVTAIRRQAAAAGLAAHQADAADRPARLLTYAHLGLELARRTGEVDALARAASAAERSARLSANPASAAAAHLVQAICAVTAGVLFADPSAVDAAQEWMSTVEIAATPGLAAEAMAMRARIAGARALTASDMDLAVQAAGIFDDAVERLDEQVRSDPASRVEAAALRCDRAEFLIGFGARLKDRSLVIQADADLRQLTARISPINLPLTWARAEALRGVAKATLGDLTGDSRTLFDSVKTLANAVEKTDLALSPLDRGRFAHALALSLLSLAEAVGEDVYYGHALAAFDQALIGLDPAPNLPLRAMVVHDRAAAVARQAERTGDLSALDRAEAVFRDALIAGDAAADPVAWAIAQLSLSRLYEARAELEGEELAVAATAMALNEALEVFAEHGMKSLADAAADALARLREQSRAG